jgi:acetolactate synthase-1/2/3 large subunit
LVLDVGIHKHLGGLILERNYPNSILFSNGLSSAGFGFPAAIGVKLINPWKEVICITGDGGFLMNIQDLETIVREGIKLIIILFEDKEYGLIRQYQEINYGFNYGTKFNNPEMEDISRAFGLDYYKISSLKEVKEKLILARERKGSSLLHIEAIYDYGKLI